MTSTRKSDVEWLLGLSASERARFLAMVAHELTVVTRLIAHPAHQYDPQLKIDRLRQLNDIQHRVCGYIPYALGREEDVDFLPGVEKWVLEPRDDYIRDFTSEAWAKARARYFESGA